MSHQRPDKPEPFGTLLGISPEGVPVYSSYYDSLKPEEMKNRDDFKHNNQNVFMGYKWQCVELARRWLFNVKGYVFEEVPMAYEIFGIDHFKDIRNGELLPAFSFKNGSKRPPESGCLLIWDEQGEFEVTGHVAIVTEVLEDCIRIIEQNVDHELWSDRDWARELPLTKNSNGGHTVHCTYSDTHILGWVMQTEDKTHSHTSKKARKSYSRLLARKIPKQNENWLDIEDPVQKVFADAMQGHTLATYPENEGRYFFISDTAKEKLRKATNELHAIFLKATEFVIDNHSFLQKFNFPPALIPRIEKSWHNRQNENIMGRFDFSLTEKGLKLYEYNVDSAGCQVECGLIQGLWAKAHHITEGEDAGGELFSKLIHAWKNLKIKQHIHILQDDDIDETYLALFIKSAMEKAGYSTSIIKGIENNLLWNEDHHVTDSNGTPINEVWKTWAWETAIDELRDDKIDEVAFLDGKKHINKKPKLIDILLNSEVMVYEPLWTLIPSNKAILPVLWHLYPNHQHLLESHFELTPKLLKNGYVKKPIVGRCGNNIEIISNTQETLASSGGNFENQDMVYQELFALPNINGQNIQLCSFTVEGVYAGACLRSDPSLIIQSKSDVLPLRVVNDFIYKKLAKDTL
ncbi:MAG: bifunctional glutathionylspermidine amidase/glutathionylspermidine synthase [Alphaproteobacteria bacterium CG11_big_fil_rev_8_21_14_0_20_39_49]|nr:MAG: bifunctional glutathionylspermidine amidase/glutathionylspermidine synthase [Alphaproteobacteria bacterium CG11_big_fil_rev_8_21_14_0_20_39_49]